MHTFVCIDANKRDQLIQVIGCAIFTAEHAPGAAAPGDRTGRSRRLDRAPSLQKIELDRCAIVGRSEQRTYFNRRAESLYAGVFSASLH
jgi:hypothetical protein